MVTTSQPAAFANDNAAQTGRLILRLMLGVLLLLHGVAKVAAGPGFVIGTVTSHGLPAALAYGVYIGEVLAPLLLIVGLWTRAAAVVVVINMVVALSLVHSGQFLTMTKQGGYGLELQAFYLFSAVAVALLGAGRYSVGGIFGRLN